MYIVLDADGKVLAAGETDSFVPPEGGQVIEVEGNPFDGLAAGEEAVWDGEVFDKRQRVLTPEETARKAAKALILPIAQGTVGKRFDALTATEVRALVACLLYREGALGGDGTVQPLAGWLRD